MPVLATIKNAVAARKGLWIATTLGFVISYYGALLLSVMVRFGQLPNYVTRHHYIDNVLLIIRSTPSIRDMVPIILDEWLLEVGHMDYDYGHGIADWSLEIIPLKLLIVSVLGALVATNLVLLRRSAAACTRATRYSGLAATGLGATLVGFTSITMMWVVCCATPSWAVGLALLGVGVSTAFGLQPFGTGITVAGFAILSGATLLLARREQPGSAQGVQGRVTRPRLAQHEA